MSVNTRIQLALYSIRAQQFFGVPFLSLVVVALISTIAFAETPSNTLSPSGTDIPNKSSTLPTVASINLCADQLVLLLAEPQQIVSLSNLSHEKAGSYLYEQARQYPVNTGSSEQILALEPNVVIAGQYTAKNTVKLLQELGIVVEIIPIANNLEQLYLNIENVALWLDRQSAGETLVAKLRASIAEYQSRHKQSIAGSTDTDTPSAAYYDPNGYTVGNDTMRGQVLQLSGWKNVASEGGITHYGTLSLESLIQLGPDAIIDSPYSVDTFSRGQQMLQHPALRASGLDPLIISIPSRQTICAGPWTVDMIKRLSLERDNILSVR